MTINDPPTAGRSGTDETNETTAPAGRLPDVKRRDRSPVAGERCGCDRLSGTDRRRLVLRRLCETGERLDVRTLVGHIADRERDRTLASTELERRQRIHASLCRTHLPALEERGLLGYDRERGLVSPGKRLAAAVRRNE